MGATRSQIRRARVIGHRVDFGEGVVVTFWYDRNKMTDVWMADWQEHERQSNAPKLNEMLADLIDRWDILENEGGPFIPVSAEAIGELFSLPDKLELMKEFMTAGVPTSAEGEASSGLSSVSPLEQSTDSTAPQPERVPQLPNGDQPSPSLEPSRSPSPT
jgi:hypothetical protein